MVYDFLKLTRGNSVILYRQFLSYFRFYHSPSCRGRITLACRHLGSSNVVFSLILFRAGKMMVAAGKTMSYTGQQRLAIRVPLVRLYQVPALKLYRTKELLINLWQPTC